MVAVRQDLRPNPQAREHDRIRLADQQDAVEHAGHALHAVRDGIEGLRELYGDQIRGPLIIEGGVGAGVGYALEPPVMLPASVTSGSRSVPTICAR